MSLEYTIVKFDQNILSVQANNKFYSVPLFLKDGKYPEGEELNQLIISTINSTNLSPSNQIGSNADYIKAMVKSPISILTKEETEKIVRSQRARILLATDWTQMPDSPLSENDKTSWANYRRLLRDLTNNPSFPLNVSWPIAPMEVKDEYGNSLTDFNGQPIKK